MPQLKTTIDENAGFCFGVVKAIAAAEQQLDDNRSLYCLGDIVHNNAEVQRLRDKGLKVVSRDDLPHLAGHSVLIRAHGEPPSTYALAERNNIRLIDATCPIVLALQQKIRRGYQEMLPVGGQIVIFGKPGHAEVIGLNGQTDNSAIIVSSPDDIGQIDFARPIRLYSQTTKSKEDYQQLIRNIEASLLPQSNVAVAPFQAFDTICNRVSHRAAELRTFAQDVDLLLFVSDTGSSNGHYLFTYCQKFQPNTHLISDASQLCSDWFADLPNDATIGISGATSTPRWLMEQVASAIESQ